MKSSGLKDELKPVQKKTTRWTTVCYTKESKSQVPCYFVCKIAENQPHIPFPYDLNVGQCPSIHRYSTFIAFTLKAPYSSKIDIFFSPRKVY